MTRHTSPMPWKDPQKKRDADRVRVAARRTAWIAANGPCRECGGSEELEVDHVDPKTKVSHRIWSFRQEKREEELAKCQVLCKSCHQKKTNRENYEPVPHGTHTRYMNYKCRCDACRAAHAAKNTLYRRRAA